MMSTVELMNKGMRCLTSQMGVVEAEEFISLVIQEKFDYTKWQREYFDKMPADELHRKAIAYAKEHPYQGNAKVIIE